MCYLIWIATIGECWPFALPVLPVCEPKDFCFNHLLSLLWVMQLNIWSCLVEDYSQLPLSSPPVFQGFETHKPSYWMNTSSSLSLEHLTLSWNKKNNLLNPITFLYSHNQYPNLGHHLILNWGNILFTDLLKTFAMLICSTHWAPNYFFQNIIHTSLS